MPAARTEFVQFFLKNPLETHGSPTFLLPLDDFAGSLRFGRHSEPHLVYRLQR